MAVFSLSSGERKRKPRGDRKSQERSFQLKHAMEAIIHLELYPRSQIDIFVETLQVDGSEYCASVNAATLAIIDAGIPIKVGHSGPKPMFNKISYRQMRVIKFNYYRPLLLFLELCHRLHCNIDQHAVLKR